jgi:transposase
MWCVAELNAEYVRKMEDVLALYEQPLDASEPVVCVDEKPVTLHQDVRPTTSAAPGQLAHRDNEYKRCGTANVFCAVEPQAGRHFTCPTPRRTALEFARMAAQIVIAYPAAKTIHLVLDNLNIHCRKSLVGCYGEEFGDYLWKRFSVHYTPKHGSWLNQAEIEISLFSRQCLGRRRIPDLAALQAQAQAWNEQTNWAKTKIDWQFSRKDARRKLGYQKSQFTRSEH